MPGIIDERIVNLKLNNKEFEEGTKESLTTIEKLQKALKFEGCVDALKDLQNAGKNFAMDSTIAVITTLNDKVTNLGWTVRSTFETMVWSAKNMASNLSYSLSTAQIGAGWDKYMMKTKGVQTIMAATSEEFKDAGNQMSIVEGQLEKLNWFTDETSYSFSDMVNNIGKFTSNNIKLEDSVKAMEGISVWAARSGGGVNEASRAMYNLSQAMSAGVIKYQDWRSIELANMSTTELKKTVLEAGVAVNELRKVGDAYFTKGGTKVDIESFTKNLSTGWFTKDVFMKAMDMYGAFTDELYKFTEATDETATSSLEMIDKFSKGTLNVGELSKSSGKSVEELTGMLEKLSSQEMELGRNAFKSAQEAKTFAEAIDATKDAVSTGWMTTWEHIFGNYEESKIVWTKLANELYDVFADWGNDRNDILKMWHRGIYEENEETGEMILVTAGAYQAWLNSIGNIWEGIKGMISPVTEAFDSVFGETNTARAEKLIAITNRLEQVTGRFREFFSPVEDTVENISEKTDEAGEAVEGLVNTVKKQNPVLENIRRVFTGIFSAISLGLTAIGKTVGVISSGAKTAFGLLMQIPLLGKLADLGDYITNLTRNIKENKRFNQFFEDATEKLNDGILRLWWNITGFYKKVEESQAMQRLAENMKKIGDLTGKFKEKTINKIGDILDKLKASNAGAAIGRIAEGLAKFGAGLLNSGLEFIIKHKDTIHDFFSFFSSGITAVLDIVANLLGRVGDGISTVGEKAGEATTGLGKWFSDTFGSVGDSLMGVLGKLAEYVQQTFGIVGDTLTGDEGFFELLGKVIGGFFQAIKDGTAELKWLDLISMIVKVKLALGPVIEIIKTLQKVLGFKKGATDFLTETFKKALKTMDAFKEKARSEAIWNYAKAVAAVAGSIFLLSLVPTEKLLTVAGIMTGIAVALGVLWIAYKKMTQDKGAEVPNSPSGIFGQLKGFLDGIGDSAKSFSLSAGLSALLLSFAGSIILITKALKTLVALTKEDPEVMTEAFSALILIMGALAGVAFAMSKFSKGFKFGNGLGLVLFAAAIGILVKITKSIAEIMREDPQGAIQAGGILIALMGVLTGVAVLISKFGNKVSVKSMAGLMIFAVSVGMLVGSLKSLTELSNADQGALSEAIAGLVIIMGSLVGVAVLIQNFGNKVSIKSMGAILIFTIAVGKLVSSLKGLFKMSSEDSGALNHAVGMLTAILGVLTTVAAALSMLKINTLPLVGLAGALLVFAMAMGAIKPLPDGAQETIGTMVGLILMLGTVGGILSFVAPSLMGVSTAFLAFAGACTLMAIAIRLVSDKLPAFSQGLTLLGPALIQLAKDCAKGIITFIDETLKALNEALPSIVKTLESIFQKLLNLIVLWIPVIARDILRAVGKLVNFIADAIPEYTPKILRTILKLLDGIADVLWNALIDFGGWVSQKINDIFESAFSLPHVDLTKGIDKIKAWGNNLLNFNKDAEKAGEEAGNAFTEGFKHSGKFELGSDSDEGVRDHTFTFTPRTDEASAAGEEEGSAYAFSFMSALDVGMGDFDSYFENLDKAGMMAELQSICNEMGVDANELLGAHGLDAGTNFMTQLSQGLDDTQEVPVFSLSSLHEKFTAETEGIVGDAYPTGENFDRGLANGIAAFKYIPVDAARSMAQAVISETRAAMQEHSPSKIGREIGQYWSVSLGLGIDDKADKAIDSSTSLARSIIASTKIAMDGVQSYMNDETIEPVVSPVFDSSNLQNGVNEAKRMFSRRSAVMASVNHEISIMDSERRRAQRYNDARVIRAIRGLDDSVTSLRGAMKMDVVMDSGELVGSISQKMNTRLGRDTNRRRRR